MHVHLLDNVYFQLPSKSCTMCSLLNFYTPINGSNNYKS